MIELNIKCETRKWEVFFVNQLNHRIKSMRLLLLGEFLCFFYEWNVGSGEEGAIEGVLKIKEGLKTNVGSEKRFRKLLVCRFGMPKNNFLMINSISRKSRSNPVTSRKHFKLLFKNSPKFHTKISSEERNPRKIINPQKSFQHNFNLVSNTKER